MPSARVLLRLLWLYAPLPLLGAGVVAWRPVAAQGVPAHGQISVRVTVLEPVPPMALSRAEQPPHLERDPLTGRAVLRVGLATDASITTLMGDDATPFQARWSRDSTAGDALDNRRVWRVTLPAESHWPGDTLEVRFTTRTGEAETTAIARVSRASLRTLLAADGPRDFRRGEPGLF